MENKPKAWKQQKEGFEKALSYMHGRMMGTIKSLETPWSSFNEATIDGLEWHSLTVIGARPGNGKTLIVDQLIREAPHLNPGIDFRVLQFQFEMMGQVSALRYFSSYLEKPYKTICSAGEKLTPEMLKQCHEHAKKIITYPIDVVEDGCTVEDFENIIIEYMNDHQKLVEKIKVVDGKNEIVKVLEFTKTIISLDHSLLLKKGKGDKDKSDTLFALGESITKLKRKYPIAFIVLTQLNRSVEAPERNEQGKASNYIITSDVYGSDALLQYCDFMVGINMPANQNIIHYGPHKYIIQDDTMVWHILKARNARKGIAFFQAQFDKMKIVEIPEPPLATKR